MMTSVYFDHNASTKLDPAVFLAMRPFLEEQYGNASCLYQLGVDASYAVEKARLQTARLINAEADELIFTSGGTESDNHALMGAVLATQKKHIVTTAVEHPAVLNTCHFLEQFFDCRVDYLPVDAQGFVDPADVEAAITSDTALVSVMAANNEIGAIQPIVEIAAICRKREVLFHTDAVQAAGRMPIDVRLWGVDLLSLSGHKMYGPKGVGALFIRKNIQMTPFIHGGGQENGFRAGTENVPAIVGMGAASQLARNDASRRIDHLQRLAGYLWEALKEALPTIKRNSPESHCLPGVLNISLPGVNAREFVRAMDEQGFCLATGSACSTGRPTPSYVLKSMGKSDADSLSAIRISLGKDNAIEEMDRFVQTLPLVLEPFRKMG
ncbi:MAG: cysteine desulfurase [Candidatus Omnitrophica bacterium]|nr:cysteine desulfurase [Candidatus Omnitrophota bacterium]